MKIHLLKMKVLHVVMLVLEMEVTTVVVMARVVRVVMVAVEDPPKM